MFKHPTCGGKHETILQAKDCDANAKFAAETEAGHAHFLATGRDEDAEAFLAGKPSAKQSAILDSMRRPQAPSPSTPAKTFQTTARPATEPQLRFLVSLGAERDLTGLSAESFKTIELLAAEVSPNFEQAHNAIGELKAQPKRQDVKAARTEAKQGWRALAEQVPDGRYALRTSPTEGGQDKPHFYRVSRGRNGFIKLQEQASDSLYPIELRDYAKIFEAILAFDVEKSGVLYAELIGSCRRCGRALTDENNPYKAVGYGPDCGAKA